MSGILHLDCSRAQTLFARYADEELDSEESAWLDGHLAECGECRGALAAFTQIDSELTAWGRGLAARNPPAANAREQLARAITGRRAFWQWRRWVPAAAAIAAGIALFAFLPRHRPPAVVNPQSAFVAIPYLAPLDPHENATVVRIQIRVATLIAVGYRVTADPDEVVPADVLVGEDGRAHAVRVPPELGLNGIGD